MERLEVSLSNFEKKKINYQEFEKAFIEIGKGKSVGKGKSGSLYDERFTQSNYEKIGMRN